MTEVWGTRRQPDNDGGVRDQEVGVYSALAKSLSRKRILMESSRHCHNVHLFTQESTARAADSSYLLNIQLSYLVVVALVQCTRSAPAVDLPRCISVRNTPYYINHDSKAARFVFIYSLIT